MTLKCFYLKVKVGLFYITTKELWVAGRQCPVSWLILHVPAYLLLPSNCPFNPQQHWMQLRFFLSYFLVAVHKFKYSDEKQRKQISCNMHHITCISITSVNMALTSLTPLMGLER